MANKRFRFVSPGIQLQEVDNSFFPKATPPEGAVVIGRAERGPGMRPVTVSSLSDFINTFGNAIPGKGSDDADVWRDGNYAGPTYGAYAAQAYLKANIGPVTYIRLLGTERADRDGSAVRAGWTTGKSPNTSIGSNGGAYGLFVFPSGAAETTAVTGTLAAVWYLESGAIVLSGALRDTATATSGAATLYSGLSSTTQEFKAVVLDSTATAIGSAVTFNFNENSDVYIRKVFNTNPHLVNSSITQTANSKTYWLGQTYDENLKNYVSDGNVFGCILPLLSSSVGYEDMQGAFQNARTGWFISQDLDAYASFNPESEQKLFRLIALDQGASIQNLIKVSIEDIKPSQNTDISKYGTFTVVLRHATDTDAAPMVIESYTGCTLDPNSPNFIARKIGDKYLQWDEGDRRFREYGDYDNQSSYVRVEMNEDVDLGATSPEYLPYGFFGPVRSKGWGYTSGSNPLQAYGANFFDSAALVHSFVTGSGGAAITHADAGGLGFVAIDVGVKSKFTGSVKYPELRLRNSASDGMTLPKNAYFGVQTTRLASDAVGFDPSYFDVIKPLPLAVSSFAASDVGEFSFVFTLDDVCGVGTGNAYYLSGSRAVGASLTSASYSAVLDAGFDRFTAPLFGGFDGLNVTEKEPFRNTGLSSKTELTSYAYASLQRAIDTVSDPEYVEMNLAAMPGITESSLTDRLINVCEDRGDTLALIDPAGGYVPSTENTSSKTTNRGTAETVVSNMKTRKPDSSYAAAYYPWVQINDPNTNQLVWLPPSAIMLGTLANSENESGAPWFAPAGFNRGGLTNGMGGFPVINVAERLTKKQRDELYDVNVNPIAKFPREGIVVFGQKTLQLRPSALDRVNVRRMMIYIKKAISRVANNVLFDQNVNSTWNRFKDAARPILSDAKVRFGITDYKLVLDRTTTTPDLIDQNAVYAKIAIKPAKAIEYIFIDFNITNSGASFDD
jgi:hypothetical protein